MLPGCSEGITYTLYPLLAGNVHLPKLSLSVESHSPGQPTSLDPLLARILPTHVYIMVSITIRSPSSSKAVHYRNFLVYDNY